MLQHGYSPNKAINDPRIHHQLSPNELVMDHGFTKDIYDAVHAMGHTILLGNFFSGVSAIKKTKSGIQAASDHRKEGGAAFSPGD